MTKFLLSLFLAVFTAPVLAEARLPVSARVPNQAPGCCFWACLETMARAQGVRQLHGLLESRKADPPIEVSNGVAVEVIPAHAGCIEAAVVKFSKLGFLAYHYQHSGRKDPQILRRANETGKGAVVHVILDSGECHAIVVLGYGERCVKYWDPNLPNREYLWDTRENFDRAWDGLALVLD